MLQPLCILRLPCCSCCTPAHLAVPRFTHAPCWREGGCAWLHPPLACPVQRESLQNRAFSSGHQRTWPSLTHSHPLSLLLTHSLARSLSLSHTYTPLLRPKRPVARAPGRRGPDGDRTGVRPDRDRTGTRQGPSRSVETHGDWIFRVVLTVRRSGCAIPSAPAECGGRSYAEEERAAFDLKHAQPFGF